MKSRPARLCKPAGALPQERSSPRRQPRSVQSDGCECKQGVAFANGALVSNQDDAAVSFRFDGERFRCVQGADDPQRPAATDLGAQFCPGHKETIVRRRMMHLQVRLLSIRRNARFLGPKFGFFARHHVGPPDQIVQATIQRAQITRFEAARAAALHVDRGDVARVGRTEGSTGQEGSSPAPKLIEARGHGALGASNLILLRQVPDPRQEFVRHAATVQIDVVSALREELSVKQVRKSRGDRSASATRKRASQIRTVTRMTTLTSEKGRFVQHRNHDDRPSQLGRAPRFRPLAKQGWSFVFVAVSRSVEQEHGPWTTAGPDPRVEANVIGREAAAVKTGRQGF